MTAFLMAVMAVHIFQALCLIDEHYFARQRRRNMIEARRDRGGWHLLAIAFDLAIVGWAAFHLAKLV